jgi:chromosome segregation ATPase
MESTTEELQSMNEELEAVNDELQQRNAELAEARGDLMDLLSSLELAVVLVGRDLRIRRFTPIVEREWRLQPGDVGRLLRREGLYSSHLTAWRKARRKGSLQGLASKKRGAKPARVNPLEGKVRELEAKVVRLEKELHTAHTILDVQGKVAGLLGLSLNDGKNC